MNSLKVLKLKIIIFLMPSVNFKCINYTFRSLNLGDWIPTCLSLWSYPKAKLEWAEYNVM